MFIVCLVSSLFCDMVVVMIILSFAEKDLSFWLNVLGPHVVACHYEIV